MANSVLLLLNHVYLLTYNALDVPSIQLCLRLRWTHTGEREQYYEQMNDKYSFFPSNIRLTQVVCPSTAVPWARVFPLRGMYIITC